MTPLTPEVTKFITDELRRAHIVIPRLSTDRVAQDLHDIVAPTRTSLIRYSLSCAPEYLYLTTINDRPCVVHLRNGLAFRVLHRFCPTLCTGRGTLLEGYYCDPARAGNSVFLITDILLHRGASTDNQPFGDRLRLINRILDEQYRHDPVLSEYRVTLIDYVQLQYLASLLKDHAPKQTYRRFINGIVIVPTGAHCTRTIVPTTIIKGHQTKAGKSRPHPAPKREQVHEPVIPNIMGFRL